ncbi:thaumatin family protein [Hymenobacter terrenus]|uniref:thaumatin family protein n=1 Tax=Hymenobacter terrenus TaxID=1629124 RepID=UPI0018CE5E93|nr:thaumatin family protein [Hymenobacter terrenus]
MLLVLQLVSFNAKAQRTIITVNKSSKPVWVGVEGKILVSSNPDVFNALNPNNGGWYLAPNGGRVTVTVPNGWEGRFWGRTGCQFDANGNGTCETGDCGNGLNCKGSWGKSATLAEFKFNGWQNMDFYDVSLIDGYNIPMLIIPVPGSFTPAPFGNRFNGGTAGCTTDLNPLCPPELQIKNAVGQVISWLSTCSKFNTDQYCCYANDPNTCKPNYYSQIMKAACPDAYSYVTDDPTSVFVCTGATYEIVFPEPTPPPGVPTGVATFYRDCGFGGASVGLPIGNYTLAQLQAKGILNDDISSLKVNPGYAVQLFDNDNFDGASITVTTETHCLFDSNWNDRASSVKVVTAPPPAFTTLIQAEAFQASSELFTEPTTDTGGGQNVAGFDTNDWLAYYNVNFPTSGAYLIEYRVASLDNGGRLSADLNAGTLRLGELDVPYTGSWQNWQTISHTVNVNAGTYNFGVFATKGRWNINWFRITKAGSARTARVLAGAGASNATPVLELYPNPATNQLSILSTQHLADYEFRVLDALGRVVANGSAAAGSVDVSKLMPGIYTVVLTAEGKEPLARRFTK